MRRALPLVLFALSVPLGSLPVFAQMPTTAPGTPDPLRVVAGTYKVDPSHTQILWQLNHMGFSLFDGAFGDPTGTLQLDPKKPGAAVLDIEIPIARITTTNAKLNEHLLSADFFDATKFPTATFKSTRVEVNGQTANIQGNLTLKGVTKPVVLAATFIGAGTHPMTKGTAIGFRATTTIKRSEFSLGYGVPVVGDTVTLTINAAFDLQK
ncbi:YceI family protein [Sphingomonas sp.]|uniref:YceI family protein n=1 Tax=Sphingomonas sp. TaxID=28214 RepID=UPI0025F1A582|nr:YceI family protein [Sphingomonas sp.]